MLTCTTVSSRAQSVSRLRAMAPERLPVSGPAQARVGSDVVSADDLEERDRANRLAELAELRSAIQIASARGDDEGARAAIEDAVARLSILLSQPGVVDDKRFADAYRAIVTEYELHYGPIDSSLEIAFGDVFAVRDELFSTLEGLEDPLGEEQALWHLPVETTVPMTVNRSVTGSMEFLRERRPATLVAWLERAHTYFPMIEQIFREVGIPDELKYLGMIESGLNPRARSRARAVGMWQFVAGTGRAYGLQIDRWVDERRDPEKATRAAARHLKDLYELHGDWHVALAGYNCSPRCINRAKRRARAAGAANPTYWDMYRHLPRETRGYVPNLIATAIMLSDPEAYGIRVDEPGFRYEYELVPIRGSLPLRDVARMAGTDVATIRLLNPSLLRDFLPPSAEPFPLRLPVGTADAFLAAYADLPPDALKPPGEHIVKRGDTLSEIADRYGVSVSRLKSDNNLRSNLIRVGQRLVVPMSNYELPFEIDLAEAQPVLVEYGTMRNRKIASSLEPPAPPTTPTPAAAEATPRTATPVVLASDSGNDRSQTREARTVVTYEIRRGDVLSRIADRYGVSVRDLQRWNDLRSTRIRAGGTLTIYLDGSTPPRDDASEPVTYRVRSGDTLGRIASQHGVSVSDLRTWNDIRGSLIRPGQRLRIYPSGTGREVRTHTVSRGDNLYDIARRYGVTVTDLRSWNGLSSSRIYPGQQLRILR